MGSEHRQRQAVIKVRVTEAEKQALETQAVATGLSLSSYLRNVGLNYPIKSNLDQRAVTDLARVAGDIGRLGGLLKLWLSNDERFQRGLPGPVDVQTLFDELKIQSKVLKESVQRVVR